jgi:hypothetical protein
MKRACYVLRFGYNIVRSQIDGFNCFQICLRFFLADRHDLKEALYKRSVRVVVLATTENLLNVPEYSSLPSSWNHIRGLSPTLNLPLITVSDENLQCSNDKYKYSLHYLLIVGFSLSNDTLSNKVRGSLSSRARL